MRCPRNAMGEHDYGRWDAKPVSVCLQCGERNLSLRSFIGQVTRMANASGVSWVVAERRLRDEVAVREMECSQCGGRLYRVGEREVCSACVFGWPWAVSA